MIFVEVDAETLATYPQYCEIFRRVLWRGKNAAITPEEAKILDAWDDDCWKRATGQVNVPKFKIESIVDMLK